jgi:hypothetical protein
MIKSMSLHLRFIAVLAAILLLTPIVTDGVKAQTVPRRLALKSGESVELYPVYWVINCRSVMIGLPEVEVLEGPPQLSLSIREEKVLPRRQGCAAEVPGGTLLMTAKDVTEKAEATLTYRLKYKTRAGDRQTSGTFIVSLFP